MNRDLDPHLGLTPSVLDRLIGPAADDPSWWQAYGVSQTIDAVRRDLEDLLNTHRSWGDLPEGFVELRNSVFTFGLPDPPSLLAHLQRRDDRLTFVEEIVGRFEPRLREIRIRPVDSTEPRLGRLRFRIEARLSVEPAPEVEFETILDLATGRASIESSGG